MYFFAIHTVFMKYIIFQKCDSKCENTAINKFLTNNNATA